MNWLKYQLDLSIQYRCSISSSIATSSNRCLASHLSLDFKSFRSVPIKSKHQSKVLLIIIFFHQQKQNETKQGIEKLSSLRYLALSDNPCLQLLENELSIHQRTRMRELYLGGVSRTSLPVGLADCINLTLLDVFFENFILKLIIRWQHKFSFLITSCRMILLRTCSISWRHWIIYISLAIDYILHRVDSYRWSTWNRSM